jgi:indole-3-pyruvate monooxygenase
MFSPNFLIVQIRPAIRHILGREVRFLDGQSEEFDAIVLATGYRSNIPFWLKVIWLFYSNVFSRFLIYAGGNELVASALIIKNSWSDHVSLWNGQDRELFSDKDGLPRKPIPNGWKGEKGLYSVGFTRRGIMGTSVDARRIAHDIEQQLKSHGLHPDVFL